MSYTAIEFEKLGDDEEFKFFYVQIGALLTKRAYYFIRDTRNWIMQYIIPVAFVLLGVIIVSFLPLPSQPEIELRYTDFNGGVVDKSHILPFPYSNSSELQFCLNCGTGPQEWSYFQDVHFPVNNDPTPIVFSFIVCLLYHL